GCAENRLSLFSYLLSSFQGTWLLLEATSLLPCAEEFIFLESTCRRRRKWRDIPSKLNEAKKRLLSRDV
ncbi:hypothetical protein, partial [Anoxybacillus flavithermus]|uniref:hypothetical protein n=1 Tax=Anoxybacillus flavithermus TaxID=33934 RepID=UPI0019D6E83E